MSARTTPALTVSPGGIRDLGPGNVASLDEQTGRLWVDPTAPAEDQLRAIEEAARFLRTGDPGASRRPRHLQVVGS